MQTVNTRCVVATLVSLLVLVVVLAVADKTGTDTGAIAASTDISARA